MTILENNLQQVIEALTCPLNRAMTMVERSCDEWTLFKHPEWLVQHYIENGGATAFAACRGPRVELEYCI